MDAAPALDSSGLLATGQCCRFLVHYNSSMLFSSRRVLLLVLCAHFDHGSAGATSISTECQAAATTFEAALRFFRPFEHVVRNFEDSVSRGHHVHYLERMCVNPFHGATQLDPLAGFNFTNITLQDFGGVIELKRSDSNDNVTDFSNTLRRSLKRYGKKLHDDHSLSHSLQEIWMIMSESDQPLMMAQDVYINSWPLPVMSQYSRSSERFDSTTLGVL